MKRDADVVVVGAGPAGASAAYFLAARGLKVLLLDKRRFPREKSCGDGVTQPGVRILREMDVLDSLGDAQRYEGLRVHVRDRGSREYRSGEASDPDRNPEQGLVVPRLRLDDVLCKAAAARGAYLEEECEATSLVYDDERVAGVVVMRAGSRHEWRAPFVVCADGATSGLGREAKLVTSPRDAMGYAIRGYYQDVEDLPGMLEFYLPITDADDEFVLPSYGWVFPTGDRTANIGIGLSVRAHGANIRRLFERFLDRLRETEPRFGAIAPCGEWRGAPLRSDFVADRCVAPGILVVGDAAGLVSPFTGEGISYGLESGKLAAEAIHESLAGGDVRPVETSGYAAALKRNYGGYFETGREAAQRYELAFRVVADTFDDDRPLFALTRRAALMPEGTGGLRSSDVLEDIADRVEPVLVRLRTDLVTVDAVMIRTVQREWPFLSRLAASVERDRAVPARPATLLLLSAYVGRPEAQDVVELAAAVELAFFAALAHAGLGEPRRADVPGGRDRNVNWGDVFAVLAGNFQLAKALELAASMGGEAVRRVAEAVCALCEGRTKELHRAFDPELSASEYVELVSDTSGVFFEAVCGLGGWLAGVREHEHVALSRFGRALGVAYHLSEEVVSVTGRPTPMGPLAAAELSRGRLNLPVVLALREGGSLSRGLRDLLADPTAERATVDAVLAKVASSGSMEATLKEIRRYSRLAEGAARSLPQGPVRDSLRELADFPVDRATSELADLRKPQTRCRQPQDDGVVWTLPDRLGVAGEVERLRQLLATWAEETSGELREMVEYQLSGPSKYYRPATIFACHRAAMGSPVPAEVILGAAAVELFHNYTLVIDDVVDRDIYRRGKLTLHRRYGRTPAIATGSYLAFGATELVADDEYACRVFDELGRRLAVAECRQWRLRGQALGLDDWRGIAREDTGAMFEACARVGTRDDRLVRFGSLLGTLYHGCDDVADVRGAAALGGGRERDITDRILTLPAAVALRDPKTGRLFEEGDSTVNDALAERFTDVLPDAEEILDDIAAEAKHEARAAVRESDPLLELVDYTRALSTA